ncbi:DUF7344 domain-containing protein [Halocatena pleomorpha]|uniref:Transcriptional regulator n=1 Tax=Halocatena pleomorpha TaxID=1785090 RepID=A0A3P3R804_9EURY|nr:transcriptional regulator [Halocatena pleomorpha]RRJ29494.1 transcriptional regulator [Halocatena pleomorpha]
MNDNIFDALRDEHRRELLLDLLEHNPQSVTNQSTADGRPEQADADRQLQIAMYHTHLPKLEDYGFIQWDENENENEIVKGPQFGELRPLLKWMSDSGEC